MRRVRRQLICGPPHHVPAGGLGIDRANDTAVRDSHRRLALLCDSRNPWAEPCPDLAGTFAAGTAKLPAERIAIHQFGAELRDELFARTPFPVAPIHLDQRRFDNWIGVAEQRGGLCRTSKWTGAPARILEERRHMPSPHLRFALCAQWPVGSTLQA